MWLSATYPHLLGYSTRTFALMSLLLSTTSGLICGLGTWYIYTKRVNENKKDFSLLLGSLKEISLGCQRTVCEETKRL
ncbi:hypothetical protein EDB92DRAFT_1888017 [Lactarius akahatsu]|uniref:Uncharacterized protein n=1 Tax=Lactarius akahatsu TaxID=416441 RepID=A0AAD4QA95_9AGAM|nr:hypothetical protein EDB92DRAFT_1888017 [Lactarius akahatsu]